MGSIVQDSRDVDATLSIRVHLCSSAAQSHSRLAWGASFHFDKGRCRNLATFLNGR
jgi:hypothetical protein